MLSTDAGIENPVYFDFEPRPYQREILKARANGVKRGVSIIHRRAGKDLTMLNMIAAESQKRVGLYLYYFPTLKLAKRVIWKGMTKDSRPFLSYIPADLIKDKNEADLRLEFTNGSILQLLGTEELNANVVGVNPVGVVFSEYALQNPLAWELTRPILRENDGWAWFVYTPRGRNHGYRLYETARSRPGWFCQLLSISDTRNGDGSPIMTDADVASEVLDGMDPDLARQEYYCSFDAPMQGSYYGRLLADLYAKKRVEPVSWTPQVPVVTGWDIGVDDQTAIWFAQCVGDDVRLIDYYENSGEGFDHYAKVVLEKPYLYEAMYLPHDAAAREFGTGKTVEELACQVFNPRNIGVRITPRLDIDEGIGAVRRIFPRLRIDEERCGRAKFRGHTGLDTLASYHKKFNEDRQEYESKPHHNWASHGADALRTLALGLRDHAPARVQVAYDTQFDPMVDAPEQYEHEFHPFSYEHDHESVVFGHA